jgi:hypothetical protein
LHVGSSIVDDSLDPDAGLPHLLVIPCLFLTLMAGPLGLATYLVVKHLWHASWLRLGAYVLGVIPALSQLTNRYAASLADDPASNHFQAHFVRQYRDPEVATAFIRHWAQSTVWLVVAAIQVSRAPGTTGIVHRMLGYVGAALGCACAMGPVYYAYRLGPERVYHSQEAIESPTAALFGGAMVACLVAAVRAARASRFADHRAWMLRAIAISLCVGAQRLYLVLGEAVLPLLPPDWADTYRSHIKLIFVAHLYTGLLSTLFFTEVYGIGRTKKRKHA